jgi:(2Fe-2S) ferredoxin
MKGNPVEANYKAHLFICTNDRGPNGKRPSCCHAGSQELRDQVKAGCKEKNFPKGSVRINNSDCLDRCENGIVAVLYPEGRWFTNLKPTDVNLLVQAVEEAVKGK